MTAAEAKSKVVQTANQEVGYKEQGNNWNKYAAELDPLNVTWGTKQNQPWCGMFVLWVFYRCFGMDDALKMLCSGRPTSIPLCSAAADYFKQKGQWRTSEPLIGDVVFFIYNGGINHTGIVVETAASTITVDEGNSSDMVARRMYTKSNPVIAGYGRPIWDVVQDVPASDPKPATPSTPTTPSTPAQKVSGLPVLKRGDKGEVVRAAQFLLNGRGASCGIYGADADFGAATEAAVLAFQRRNNLEADGVIGENTWSKLLGL